MSRNIKFQFAVKVSGAVADAAGVVAVYEAHVERLGCLGEHVLEKVTEAVLEP